jgi:putative flavoprotein involved in K+ transport
VRVIDRIRPWRAPQPPAGAPAAIVIGAGPAGLASAAWLRRLGVDATVVDRRPQVGGSWPTRYDSLRLNTVRWMSDLPGHRMGRELGRWVGRDDVVAYLREYAAHHGLPVRLGAPVSGIEPTGERWAVEVDGTVERVAAVVVATGHSAQPHTPAWGVDGFRGRLLHAADYRRPADHLGRRVLVVGAGSSGGEICVDLAAAGLTPTWSVHTAPRLFPREAAGVPVTPFAPLADALPDRLVDRIAPLAERAIHGRRDYLPDPPEPMMRLLARCKEPMTADGIVDLVRRRRVRVVAAVAGLTERGARLDDGTTVEVDDVVAATGYRPGLDPLVGHLGVLDDGGRPVALVPRRGLGFVGFRIPLTGTLWAIEHDARAVARRLAPT